MSSNRERLRQLTWAQWKVPDPFCPEKYTRFYVSVYEPTWSRPYASILYKMAGGTGEVFCRFATIDQALQIVVIPDDYVPRLQEAMNRANEIANQIERDMRLALERRRLPPGVCFLRSDTGEIIAEAERIVRNRS